MWMRLGLWVAVSVLAVGQARVHGRLLDPAGAPVAGAYISVGAATFNTDSDGRYQIQFPDAGPKTLQIWQPGFAQFTIEVDLRSAQDLELPELTLRLGMCGLTDNSSGWRRLLATPDRGGLRGDVRAFAKDGVQLGAPVGKARVTLLCGSRACGTTITDAAGRYRFEDLEPGAYSIRAEQAGYYAETVDVRVIGGFESVYDSHVAMLACIRGNCIQNPRPFVAHVCE